MEQWAHQGFSVGVSLSRGLSLKLGQFLMWGQDRVYLFGGQRGTRTPDLVLVRHPL